MANKPVAELDFEKIKRDLILYIKQEPAFTDYNFEGSALNTLIDLLAYNTHYNAYYANMLHNESFLDTAQKRSSVVSKAKELGYVPKSAIASTATVDIQLLNISDTISNVVLQKGTVATSKNENGSYSFVVHEDSPLITELSGSYFRNVILKEGVIATNKYTVDVVNNPTSFYTIPNENVDISTLRVFVRESLGSLVVSEYTYEKDFGEILVDSKVYFVQESYSGLYQIYFGDDIFGRKLEDGNIIDISYVVTNKEEANGCKSFLFDTIVPGAINLVTATQSSIGGKDKENITELKDSIKKSFAAQNRAITANDYVSVIKNNVSFVKNAFVWGGEENIPPIYGKVFVSLQANDNMPISSVVKTNVIQPIIRKFNTLTVIPELVDPKYTHIVVNVDVNFNKNKTISSLAAVAQNITTIVNDYFTSDVATFNKDLLKSKLTANIVDSDAGIVSANISLTNNFRIVPNRGTRQNFKSIESNLIKKGSVSSSLFKINLNGVETTVRMVDDASKTFIKTNVLGKSKEFGTLKLVNTQNETLFDVGTIIYNDTDVKASGVFEFVLNVAGFIDNLTSIYVYYKTETEDIFASRNQILVLDTSLEFPRSNILAGINIEITNYEK